MRLRRWGSGEGLEAVQRSDERSVAAELARRQRSMLGKKEKAGKVKNAAQGTKCTGKRLGSKKGQRRNSGKHWLPAGVCGLCCRPRMGAAMVLRAEGALEAVAICKRGPGEFVEV